MAKLSKNQRRLVSETARQIVANLGLMAPVKQEQHAGGIQPEHHPQEAPPKDPFDIITEVLTVGISALLFSIFSGGIINYFGQFPQILNFGAWGTSGLIMFGAIKMVWIHKRHWAVLLIAIVASVLICIPTYGLVRGQIGKQDKETAQKQQLLENTTTTRQDVSDIKAMINSWKGANSSATNAFDNTSFPGIGLQLVLRLNGLIPTRPNYIFDFGENITSNRISLFLMTNRSPCLTVRDQNANEYSVKVQPRFDTFSFNSLTYISGDFGNAGEDSFLRIVINGRTVAYQRQPALGRFYPNLVRMRKSVVGADLERKNGSVMIIEFNLIASEAFSAKQRSALLERIDHLLTSIKPDEGGFVFRGNGGLYFGLGNSMGEPFGDAEFRPKLYNSSPGERIGTDATHP